VVNWNPSPAALSFEVTGLATAPAPAIFELPALSMAAVEIPDDGSAAAWSYGEAERRAGTGPQPLTPGATGGGNDVTDAGPDRTSLPEASVTCAQTAPTNPTITTMGVASSAGVMFGSGISRWGSFTYAGDGQPLPTAAASADGKGLAISATFLPPVMAANNYAGVGLYYSSASCLDASAYAGVAFDFSGDLGACSLRLGVSFSADVATVNDPVRGMCPEGNSKCYPPFAAVVPRGSRIEVPFSALSGGMPVGLVDPTTIVNIEWEVSAPLGSPGTCAASFTVSNAAFY
jgi:hypothetical protein